MLKNEYKNNFQSVHFQFENLQKCITVEYWQCPYPCIRWWTSLAASSNQSPQISPVNIENLIRIIIATISVYRKFFVFNCFLLQNRLYISEPIPAGWIREILFFDNLKIRHDTILIVTEERCHCISRTWTVIWLTPVSWEVTWMAVRVCKLSGPTKTLEVPPAKAMKIITY